MSRRWNSRMPSHRTTEPAPWVPELPSVRRAARRLGIDPRRLRAAVRGGELEAYQPGSRACYVRWADVLRWLRAQRLPSSDFVRKRVAEILASHNAKGKGAGD